jgi:hypothetical protein
LSLFSWVPDFLRDFFMPETTIAIPEREKLNKKAITADHPTWCPGCPESFRGAAPNRF